MKCSHCQRYYHFKPYCIEDDIMEMDETEMFKCRLCRIDFWVRTLSSMSLKTFDFESVEPRSLYGL